jgi:opacity protein-like surface antigen
MIAPHLVNRSPVGQQLIQHAPNTRKSAERTASRGAKGKLNSKYPIAPLLSAILFFTLQYSSAQAQEQPATGPYIGLGMGIAVDRFDGLASGVDYDPGLGFVLNLGYRFHPNIAVEGSCEYFTGIHSDDLTPPSTGDILTFAANAKGYLSTRRTQPYILFGLGVTRVHFDEGPDRGKDVGVSLHIGGGLDYYLVPGVSFGIKAAYVAATGKIDDRDHVSIGLGAQYRF